MKESIKDKLFQNVITFVLCILGFIALIPLISVVAMSFSSKAAADMNIVNLLPVGFTFASWKYIITDGGLWRSFFITLTATLTGTALALVITSLMAYPLSKSNFKLGRVLMLFVIITMVFKAPIVPYFLTVKGMGLFNNPLVLVLPQILTAYNLAIMRTFFKQFPAEVEEAAKIDGCGYFRILYKIILPSSKAVLTTVGLFYAVTIWNQFQHPIMFIQDTDLFPLQLKIRQLISGGSEILNITMMSHANYTESTLSAAAVVFAIAPIIAIYPWLQKYFAQGAMLGSVKG
ncbi:MAG: carbohydrate ABC transporter permease [Suipraeoptans sp.]